MKLIQIDNYSLHPKGDDPTPTSMVLKYPMGESSWSLGGDTLEHISGIFRF